MFTRDEEIEKECKTIIMEIMMVLYKHGIKQVHMGGMLRLMGVDEELAQESDNDIILLDEKFTRYLERMLAIAEIDNQNKTVH